MKYLKKLTGLIIAAIMFTNSHAQTANFAGWLATFYTYTVNEKIDIIGDVQVRSSKQVKHVSTILLRSAINYKFNKQVSLAVGYALNDARREVGELSELIPEHRLWQNVILRHKIKSASTQHRFRLEQRFLPKVVVQNNSLAHDGYNYANRFRYFTRTFVPFTKNPQFVQGPYGAFQNEVFLNFGNKSAVNKKIFDQNRLYGAVGYRFSRNLDAEAGYLNQYISGTNKRITNNHILQLATYINL